MSGTTIPNYEPEHLAEPDWLLERQAAEMDLAGLTVPTSAAGPVDTSRLIAGGSFLFDQPDGIPAVWGRGDEVLWSEGEALWLVGLPGVGKTTLVGQLVRGRIGLADEVLHWPVQTGTRRTLYLAMDRPKQIARSLRRHFTDAERSRLDERLLVWKGPPPADVARQPGVLRELCQRADADTLVIDSVKDAAIKLTDDEVGAAFNRAVQAVTVDGIEVVCLHHQRKNGTDGNKPNTLADVYGSTWLTAGAGSVLLLWGVAGDPIVDLVHLKQPASLVGPLRVEHDHYAGTSSIVAMFDPLRWLRNCRNGGTAADAARQMFEHDPTDPERKRAERKLDDLVRRGLALKEPAVRGGPDGTQPARFYVVDGTGSGVER